MQRLTDDRIWMYLDIYFYALKERENITFLKWHLMVWLVCMSSNWHYIFWFYSITQFLSTQAIFFRSLSDNPMIHILSINYNSNIGGDGSMYNYIFKASTCFNMCMHCNKVTYSIHITFTYMYPRPKNYLCKYSYAQMGYFKRDHNTMYLLYR